MNLKQIGKNILETMAIAFVSGMAALLCARTLTVLFGLFFWGLDGVFGFVNLPAKFEYNALSLLRSIFFWMENVHLAIFFALWVVIFFLVFIKREWIKNKLWK